MNPYDELAYESHVHTGTHPDRLATIATLRGLTPADPARCRMLDLACGDGTNILCCAQASPGAEFLGVDLAAAPVARANELAAAAGLRNVRVVQGDFTAPDPAWGTFDYVSAHGVYSWVPAETRERLMATIAASLRPGGVAFVRYRVKPGGIARDLFRNLMLLHTESAPSVDEKVKQAYEFVRFLLAARTFRGEPFDDWVRSELETRAKSSPANMRHDDLGEFNEPIWYREFAAQAARHGLSCLGDSDWSQDTDVAYPPEVRAAFDRYSDSVEREQYRDLVKFRRLRETLLVRRENAPTGGVRTDRIPGFLSSAKLTLAGPELPPGAEGKETFQSALGGRIETDVRVVRAALHLLRNVFPQRIAFEELLAAAARTANAAGGEGARPTEAEREALHRTLTSLHEGGMVTLHSHAPEYARTAGERPAASPLARLSAQRGLRVVSLLQHLVDLSDPRARRLLGLLDGTLDRAEILRRLAAAEAPPAAPPLNAAPLTAQLVDETLDRLARWGVLVA